MMNFRKTLPLLAACLLMVFTMQAQETITSRDKKPHLSSQKGQTTLGLGLGLPYGAIGVRVGTNIVDGLNLFGGLGYQLAGAGYNIGLLKDFPSAGMAQFYLTGMYGTNAAIKILNLSEYDRVYTGPSFGLGVKFNSRMKEGNYWDAGLLLPVRSNAYKEDEQRLMHDPRIGAFSSPWPVLIVVGYNFNL